MAEEQQQGPGVRRFVLINPKGGSGKSTIATNICAYLAHSGARVAIRDFDVQGSSLRWISKRPADRPAVHGVNASKPDPRMTRSFQLRVPPGTEYIVSDTPAAVPAQKLGEFTHRADRILIPVGSSDIDMHAAANLVRDLLLVAREDRRRGRVGVIANRVKARTVAHGKLMRFLGTLQIPVVAELRDSQNYLHAADAGLGIHEFQPSRVKKDLEQWQPLLTWLGLAPREAAEGEPVSFERLGAPRVEKMPQPANEATTVVPFHLRRSNDA